jgi:putative addiction module killer protein
MSLSVPPLPIDFMEPQPREILPYQDTNGNYPFEDWLTRLRDRNARANVQTRLERLSLGNLGDSKFVGEGVYELRIDYGGGYRIYFDRLDQGLYCCCAVAIKALRSVTFKRLSLIGGTMQSVKVLVKTHEDFLIESLKDPEEAAAYVSAALEEEKPEPELLPLCLGHVTAALGGECDRKWVKDFGASDKSQAVYELAAWLDSFGLKLTVSVKQLEQA